LLIHFIVVCCLVVASATAMRGSAAAAATPVNEPGVDNCVACHRAQAAVLSGTMATRPGERAFANRAFGTNGDRFFNESCGGCHVTGCRDCHGSETHPTAKPAVEACVRCHRGYFTGSEYLGRAPRDDHERYQRGPSANGEPFLKMLPDVHHEGGLSCADCHTVHPSHGGAPAVRTCAECHPQISTDVPEHAIKAHTEKMECYACHAAWSAQEYGTFLVRPVSDAQREAFSALPSWGPWVKSAYLKRQDAPPLGLDARGLVAPIRPQFLLLVSATGAPIENRLVAAEWRAGFPHTVRRGTVPCAGCHDTPRRFILEPDEDRMYRLEQDGLPLRSFWNREGQQVVNGAFLPADRYVAMNRRTPEYVREYIRQWQRLLGPDARSSRR
jgi:hypothetical protein